MGVYSLTKSTINNWTKYSSMMAGSVYVPPPGDYELISTQLISTATATVTFSSIPSTYKHLQLRITHRQNSGTSINYLNMRFNGDTTANQATHWLTGDQVSVLSSNRLSSNYVAVGKSPYTANQYGTAIVDILDYTNTTKNKTVRSLSGSNDSANNPDVTLFSGLWPSTAAITSILFNPGNSFAAGSRLSLYGLKG